MRKFSVRTAVVFSFFVFATVFITVFLTMTITFTMFRFGLLTTESRGLVVLVPMLASTLVGTLLSLIMGRHSVKLVEQVNDAIYQVATGNFNVKLEENFPILELRGIAKNFNVMTRELAGTEMLRNDFVENVSHEFKTPLTAIEGYATLLQQKNLPEEKRLEYTQRILHSTRRLNNLTGDILLLSRLEHQELEIQKELYSLDEQLREVMLLLEADWAGKQIDLDIQLDDCICNANPSLLSQVWQNIFGNAIKFAPVGGTVRIQLTGSQSQITVSVSDNGPGISAEVQKRIFEKFYQGDTTRSTQGNGLGLALAKRIIDLHAGTITVESLPNAGTTFTVTLPAAERQTANPANN